MSETADAVAPAETAKNAVAAVPNPVARTLVRYRMPVVLGVLIVVTTVLSGGVFAHPANLVNVARQISFEALIAFGMTFVIVTGGIDLSVGSLVACTGVVAALAMRPVLPLGGPAAIAAGLLAGVAAGAAAGALSGLVITRFRLPPFLVTLAAMLVARGAAFILCSGEPVYEGLPPGLSTLGRGFVLEGMIGRVLPVPVLLLLAGFVAGHLLLSRTVFGRCVIAVGSNEEAARLSGIAVAATRRWVYVLTGALAGLVGVMNVGKLMAADPKVADMWELNVIAAVVVGGTSLFGGRGSIPGTLVGALIIGVLNNGLNLLHVQHFWQLVVLGLVILGAALLDAALRGIGERSGGGIA